MILKNVNQVFLWVRVCDEMTMNRKPLTVAVIKSYEPQKVEMIPVQNVAVLLM